MLCGCCMQNVEDLRCDGWRVGAGGGGQKGMSVVCG